MKRLWFILLWLALSVPAFAQPVQCPDRPTADSSNACANTRFVHAVGGGGGGGGGIINVGPSLLATAAVLPNTPTYSNGASGVGATLTAGSNSTLTVDGTVAVLANIVLVKNQAAPAQNGIYTVTNAGSGAAAWVLTRVTYFDQAAEMLAGSYTYITGGATLLNTAWNLQTSVTTVGASDVNFVLFSAASGLWTQSGADIYRPAGNIGLRNIPSAWASNFGVFQIGTGGFIDVTSSNTAGFFANVYFDGTNYRYITNGTGSLSGINDSFGQFNIYTFPSGTAGNVATPSNRFSLSNLGVLTMLAYGAGVAQFDSSGVLSSKPAYTKSTIFAADYGCLSANSAATNNTNCQLAINACFSLRPGGRGCILQFPCGDIQVSTAFTITFGLIAEGCGKGTFATDQGTFGGGTLINQNCTSCDTFTVVAPDPVQFRDLGFNASLSQSSGSFIWVKPEAVPATNPNIGSIFARMRMRGGYYGIRCESCAGYSITDNYIHDYVADGVLLTASTALPDDGEAFISGNIFGGRVGVSLSGMRMQTQGALKIVGNKFLGHEVNFRLTVDQGVTGTILVSSNSFEEVTLNDIRIERVLVGATHNLIAIVGNEFQTNGSGGASATFQGNIVSVSPGATYITKVIISSNIFTNGHSAPLATANCINLGGVSQAIINNNICDMGGTAGWGGIAIGADSGDISVLDNQVFNPGAGAVSYSFTSGTTWRPATPTTFGNLPGGVVAGSQAFVSNSSAGGACNGAGGGAMGFFQSGVWRCP